MTNAIETSIPSVDDRRTDDLALAKTNRVRAQGVKNDAWNYRARAERTLADAAKAFSRSDELYARSTRLLSKAIREQQSIDDVPIPTPKASVENS
jgi:hypothetical protein